MAASDNLLTKELFVPYMNVKKLDKFGMASFKPEFKKWMTDHCGDNWMWYRAWKNEPNNGICILVSEQFEHEIEFKLRFG